MHVLTDFVQLIFFRPNDTNQETVSPELLTMQKADPRVRFSM